MRKLFFYFLILMALTAYADIYVPESGIWYETGENFSGSPLIYIHNMEDYDVKIVSITISYTNCFTDSEGCTVREIIDQKVFAYNNFILSSGSNISLEDFDLPLEGDYYYWNIVSIIYTYRDPGTSQTMQAEAEFYDYYESNPHMEGPPEFE